MSDIVITLLQEFLKSFAWDGVAKYPSENVALIFQQTNAVPERLAEVLELPRDTPLIILTGFTKFSVPDFFSPFVSKWRRRITRHWTGLSKGIS